jgi:uncharacterized protein YdaU (DUF1376 family)
LKLPFFQMYPADFMRDTRALSLAAKGGWIDVLCVLHSSSTRGTMTLPVVGWARVMGATVDQAAAVITELDGMRIADVDRASNGDVTLSSRRMLRDYITREQTRLRVQRHREKEACNATGNGPETVHKPETEKSEVRSQNKTLGKTKKPPNRPAGAGPASDEEWLSQLSSDPTYAGINVRIEFGKMKTWCLHNHRQPSRRRFVNWLNRCDKSVWPASNGAVPWQRDSHNSDHGKGF